MLPARNKLILAAILWLIPAFLLSQNPDIRMLRSINSPEALPSDNFFRFVSDSHVIISYGIPVTVGVSGLIKNDKAMKDNAIEMAESAAVNLFTTLALKYAVNRDRPFISYPDIAKKTNAITPSFPSGHTSTAFAAATSLSLSYPKWYIIVPSFSWAGTVGYSRMHLGAHYPSDVLAGAIIGSGSAWLTHYVNKKLQEKTR